MLRVKTYIAPSTIPGAGTGLFAAEDIPAGTLVWTHDAQVDVPIPLSVLREADVFVQEAVMRWGYQYLPAGAEEEVFVLCGDNARFINHSDDPNIGPGPEKSIDRDYALVDIPAHTEILTNYHSFDKDARRKLGVPC